MIIYVDLDGVMADYGKSKPKSFLNLKPIPGAIEAFQKLAKKHDVYILSTAPWSNPDAWKDKRLWVEKYLGKAAFKKLILSHHKHLCSGDYLIDDRLANGSEKFKGKLILFGTSQYPDWGSVLSQFNL